MLLIKYVLISLKRIKPLNAETPRRRENQKSMALRFSLLFAFPLRLCVSAANGFGFVFVFGFGFGFDFGFGFIIHHFKQSSAFQMNAYLNSSSLRNDYACHRYHYSKYKYK